MHGAILEEWYIEKRASLGVLRWEVGKFKNKFFFLGGGQVFDVDKAFFFLFFWNQVMHLLGPTVDLSQADFE